ncbi:DMT family transporter [Anianabacter salinae]|uniref:DMT family transporter n=1 Tax=Anianabacter salinae TaxID=2851023 RepID=UPI00225DF9DD|nr:DMT family transporter [Anianabacter salinae]MBV0912904.1 DMT family transporter [Anianabacter salinae]
MSAFSRLGDNSRGILLMIAAIVSFSVMDALAKMVSLRTDTMMALWARYLGQTVIVALIVMPKLPGVLRTSYPGLQALRSVFLLSATTCFFFGISFIGLAEATAIIDLNPVLTTLGAALILKEKFGPRRAIGVAVALIGALIIIRPGTAVFSPYAILPLGAAICFSAYTLTTRFVGRDEDAWTSLLYTALFGAVILSVLIPRFWVTPDPLSAVLMVIIGAIGAGGQLLMIRALMTAEASIVAPFGYVGLLFATLWGFLLFGEVPDSMTAIGGSLIVAAGVYVWWRESRVKAIPPARPVSATVPRPE